MNLKSRCICCNSTSNLNTITTILLDNQKYEVALCDTHAEDTTPRVIKDLVQKKITRYNQLAEELKEFEDMPTSPSQPSISPITSSVAPSTPKVNPIQTPSSPKVSQMFPQKVRSIGSSNVEKYDSLNPKAITQQSAPETKIITTKVEMQTVLGRGKQPMSIPKLIEDSTGTTSIHVIDTGGDHAIQENLKFMVATEPPDFIRGGYNVMECSLCGGTGKARVSGQTCPKCKGSGFLNKKPRL